jgi:pyruvate,orthophosphate dikinase
MKKNIIFFSEKDHIDKDDILKRIGYRGRMAMELASLDLPILPGFIIDADAAADLQDTDITSNIKSYFKRMEEITGKVFGDPKNPMLVKIVISPDMVIGTYPTLHNFGLTESTIEGFNSYVGKKFGYHEVLFLVKGMLSIESKIAELEGNEKEKEKLEGIISELQTVLKNEKLAPAELKKNIDKFSKHLPKDIFKEAYLQLEIAIKRISHMLHLDELDGNDTAILIQPMVYGNYGKDSASGMFFTRNITIGKKEIQGDFFQGKFDEIGAAGQDIQKIVPKYLKELDKIGRIVEDYFKEIRAIRFTIENKKLWLIDQRTVLTKSTQADIKSLLDLHARKVIDDKYIINAIKPGQLNEILHPVVNMDSVKKLKQLTGGISGAPGAAVGRVYFSTEALLEAYKQFQQLGEDTRVILCLAATFAEDVKAIEVSTGVLSCEGGYAAHASVVARQYGKVSLVKPELKIRGKKATIGDIVINEGDTVTLNVPNHGDPQIYMGTAELIEPDPQESGLLDFIKISKKYVNGFHVKVNADTPRDASLARTFGAEGIGLCRTEHMFFHEKRINVFREMILADTREERIKALNKLQPFQKLDFYKLFKIMEGKEVVIRLLDAPLHEFLPHNPDEMDTLMDYLTKGKKGVKLSKKEVQARCDAIDEFNPMLGHRGCRIAVSYPEIYAMQVAAIFEAVYTLQSEGVKVEPNIMIPLIMNDSELKLLVYGKKIEGNSIDGLIDIEQQLREKLKAKSVKYTIGTMIELPVAALGAGKIARYAEFFSFGTNDLTQTTIGLSRDDFNSFMPDYTQFDLLENNPFQVLNEHVKELISIAVKRGRMTRPSIKIGLCGEHGAIPENIEFCIEAGLNYVSCSTYSVPIANLAIAQYNLEQEQKN